MLTAARNRSGLTARLDRRKKARYAHSVEIALPAGWETICEPDDIIELLKPAVKQLLDSTRSVTRFARVKPPKSPGCSYGYVESAKAGFAVAAIEQYFINEDCTHVLLTVGADA